MSNPEPQQQPDQPGQQPFEKPAGAAGGRFPTNSNETPPQGWTRPYAGRRAAYGPPAQESYPPMPPAPPYDQPPHGHQPLGERTSALALAGFITALASAFLDLTFIFAFLGFLGSITAIVLSIIGLVRDVNGRGMKGRGFALTGIIVSGAMIVISFLVFVLLIIIGITSDSRGGSSQLECKPDYSASAPGCVPQPYDNSGTDI